MTKVPQPKRLGDFFVCLYYLGFANCQPIMYISNVEKTPECVLGVNVNKC